MPKWNTGFLERVRDMAMRRIEDRVKTELAPPTPPTDALQSSDVGEVPPEESVPAGFAQRIKDVVKSKVQNMPAVQKRMLDPEAQVDLPTVKYRLAYAGRNRLLVLMTYNGQPRHVEPYSWRVQQTKSGPKLYFFGFCRVHNRIHKFKPEKILGCIVTNETYQPRWPVEF